MLNIIISLHGIKFQENRRKSTIIDTSLRISIKITYELNTTNLSTYVLKHQTQKYSSRSQSNTYEHQLQIIIYEI